MVTQIVYGNHEYDTLLLLNWLTSSKYVTDQFLDSHWQCAEWTHSCFECYCLLFSPFKPHVCMPCGLAGLGFAQMGQAWLGLMLV
jgi:hypothetical protein